MSNLIQTTREELGLTGSQLAARLGTTAAAVSQLERSERDGTIKLASLRRALTAMGRRPIIDVAVDTPGAEYSPDALTDAINTALDQGDETFALRLLTRGAQVARSNPGVTSETTSRTSRIKDPKWEALFLAIYGEALPEPMRMRLGEPRPLERRWYVSKYPPLRERAKHSTPQMLRDLNIYLDDRSLARA